MCEQLTGKPLDQYRVPPGACIGPVSEGEVRVVQGGDLVDTALVVGENGGCKRVLPANLDMVDLLVLVLDQGSNGTAAEGFTQEEAFLILYRWDKVHRLIRDIKGALSHSLSGLCLKAQLYSSYIWNLHRKPFGNGHMGDQLKRVLNIFQSRHTIDSAIFQKHMPRIAREFGMPCVTRHEQQLIFDCVCQLPSFLSRDVVSKMGRWFSWNEACHAKLRDFTATKMLLEDYIDGSNVPDPDENACAFDDLKKAAKQKTPQAELSKLLSAGGGLRLAYTLMHSKLYSLCQIVEVSTKALWDYYTESWPDIYVELLDGRSCFPTELAQFTACIFPHLLFSLVMVEPPRPPHPQRINQTISFVCPKTPPKTISKGVFPIGKQLSRNVVIGLIFSMIKNEDTLFFCKY